MATPLYFIVHGGRISDPAWFWNSGFRGAGYVVNGAAGSSTPIPSTAPLKNVGFTDIHINPFNDGTAGLTSSGSRDVNAYASVWANWFVNAKNAGYTKVFGEGTWAEVVAQCMKTVDYGNYAGDVGAQQFHAYNGGIGTAPRGGSYPNTSTYRHYDTPETYVQGNALSQASTKSCLANANSANSAGLGILLGSWAMSPAQSGALWTSFINDCRNSGLPVNAVVFWTGYDYDITSMVKPGGVLGECFSTLKANFGVASSWGATTSGGGTVAPAGPPPAPTPSSLVSNVARGITLDITGALTKKHDGQPTPGFHVVEIRTQGKSRVETSVRIRDYQPGLE